MHLLSAIVRRFLLPVVMLGLGIVSLVWGTTRHILEVWEEQEIEISIAPPPDLMPPVDGLPLPGAAEDGTTPEFPGEPGVEQPGMEQPGFEQPGVEPPGFPDPAFTGPPGMPPFLSGLPPELQKITQTVLISKEERESRVVLEITIGGLALLETGQLRRTYTGQPPSLCPT